MPEIFEKIKIPKIGEIVEGEVLGRGSCSIFVDLGCLGIGIIYGKNFLSAKEQLRKLRVGDRIFVKIIELENDQGYVELSVSLPLQDSHLASLKEIKEKGEIMNVKIVGINKGGLICDLGGLLGFLPISQLSKENFNFLANDPEKNLEELKKLVGKSLPVKIMNIVSDRIILSEKMAKENEREISNLKEGNEVLGIISALTSFGAFLKFNGTEGLIPFSDLCEKKLRVGDRVRAKITKISNDKIFLSLL